MTPAEFIATMSGPAQAAQAKTRVPASFTIAEAALESGWGHSRLAIEGNNLFGVKADHTWQGDRIAMNTREWNEDSGWMMVPAYWRKYPDFESCLEDHDDFLSHPRYAHCFDAANGEEFARLVQQAGYATDPDYADKLITIMRAHNLAALDAPAAAS
jgi:flagellum-specific peptidoglycan hydrolase FlgJ